MQFFQKMISVVILTTCLHGPAAAADGGQFLTLNLDDVPLREALQVLADEFELNLVLGDEVTGQISVHVEELDIMQTLDVMLFGKGLSFRLSDKLLAVGLPQHLAELEQAQNQRHLSAAIVRTEYIQLNYADARSLSDMLTGAGAVVSSAADSAALRGSSGIVRPLGLLSASGQAQVDYRTNTLIVSDTAERLRAVRELLSVLDVPVRQVLIEAKIVSAGLDTGREMGVRWGLSSDLSAVDDGNPVNTVLQSGDPDLTVLADHRAASLARVAILRDQRLLDVEISALERAGEAELIARPRVTTQDNTPALIQSGVRIPYQAQAGGTAGGSTTEFVDALLSLDVTPLITPDGRIIMRLNIRQDSVASGAGDVPAINTNTITTSVLVDNGDTVVLGGIFREEQTKTETGTPGLRRIPGLGALFRREVASQHRTELLIFITPEIIPESVANAAAAIMTGP